MTGHRFQKRSRYKTSQQNMQFDALFFLKLQEISRPQLDTFCFNQTNAVPDHSIPSCLRVRHRYHHPVVSTKPHKPGFYMNEAWVFNASEIQWKRAVTDLKHQTLSTCASITALLWTPRIVWLLQQTQLGCFIANVHRKLRWPCTREETEQSKLNLNGSSRPSLCIFKLVVFA